jgi:hypothetical protein
MEGLADMAERVVRMEMLAVETDDSGRFLTAVLKGVKPKRRHGRGGVLIDDSKDAAFFPEFIVVVGVCREH